MADSLTDQLLSGSPTQQVQGSLTDRLLNGQPVEPSFVEPAGATGVFDFFTGASRTTERTRAATEIGGIPVGASRAFKIGAGLLATADPEAQANLIRSVLPEAEITQDEFGSTFVKFEGQEFILNKPGASFQDVVQTTAQILSFVPAARIKNVFGRFAAGAGTSVGLDVGAEALGAEGAADPLGVGIRSLTAGTLEASLPPAIRAVGAIGRRFRGGRAAPAGATPETGAVVEEALEAEAKIGEGLFPAQRTQIPSQLDTQRLLSELSGSSETALRAIQKQNEQAFNATIELLDSIAPASSVETGQRLVRTAAEKAVELVKTARSEKASPLFDQAFDESGDIVFRTVANVADREATELPTLLIPIDKFPKGGEIHRSLSRVQTLLKNAGNDLQRIHNVKTEIDQLIGKTGQDGLGPTTKRELVLIQNQLVDLLESQAPLYKAARDAFIEGSPAVDAIRDSIVGSVSRLDDTQLKSISQRLLDPAEVNPQTVISARRAIESVDPQAWQQIVRVEMERRLGAITEATTGAQNIPGQIVRALFPNEKSRRVLFNALPEGQVPTARLLERWLRRAASGRPGGSQTASRQELLKQIGGPAMAIRRWFTEPLQQAGAIGESRILQQRAGNIARIMFDPSFKQDVAAILRLSPEKAAVRLTDLLTAIATEEAR